MLADNGGRDQAGDGAPLPAAFLDGLQGLAAKRERLLVGRIELKDARVQVPAGVVETNRRVHDQPSHLLNAFPLYVNEAHHYVRHLHSRVVNVVLDFHVVPSEAQQPDKSVTQDGVAQMPDVRGLVGIDAGVLDEDFGGGSRKSGVGSRDVDSRFPTPDSRLPTRTGPQAKEIIGK